MKKNIFLLLIFAIVSFQALAIVPFIAAGSAIVRVAATLSTGQNVLIGTGLGLGAIITQLAIDRSNSSSDLNTSTIYYNNLPRPPTAIESSAGFTAGFPNLIPPSSVPAITSYFFSPGEIGFASGSGITLSGTASSTIGGFCSSVISSGGFQGTCGYVVSPSGTQCSGVPSGTCFNPYFFSTSATVTCPAGYISNGTSCALSNSALVVPPADGHCPIVRSGNTYAQNSTDPDCANGVAPAFAADGSFSISSADGRKVEGSLVAGNPAQRQLVYTEPDVANNRTVRITVITDNPSDPAQNPVVLGFAQSSTVGTGVLDTGVAAPAVSDSDPALLAELQAQRAELQALQAELSAAGVANPSVSTLSADIAASNLALTNSISALPAAVSSDSALGWWAWTPDFGAGVCAPFTGIVFNKSISINVCTYVEMIRSALGWLFAIFGIWYIQSIVFQRTS